MKRVIAAVGPCTLAPKPDPYLALCQAIFSQQVSTAAAASMFGKFKCLFPKDWPTPARVLKLLTTGDEATIKSCGLSRQKRSYIQDLTERFVGRDIPVQKFPAMSDEEIIQALLPVKGVGRWTAEMFLIFVMNRPDVLPVDDFGVRKGFEVFYGLGSLPDKKKCESLGEAWRPWRSVGTWYLWRGLSVEAAKGKA